MADATKISWADRTMNFWIGCSEAGPGCDHCYARTMMQDRYHRAEWGPGKPRVRTTAANWNKALKWDREAAAGGPSWVFAQSLSDFFDNEIPDEWRDDAWRRIDATKNLRWMILTKRVSNIARFLPQTRVLPNFKGDFPHVGFMITVCNQEEANRDIQRLLSLKATQGVAWIGLSIEPMLGPIDLTRLGVRNSKDGREIVYNALTGVAVVDGLRKYTEALDFVIAGGESVAGARPMHPDWPRRLRDDCASAGVPYHFKQWGEFIQVAGRGDFRFADGVEMGLVGTKNAGHLLDGKEHRAMPTVYDAPADPIYPPNHTQAN